MQLKVCLFRHAVQCEFFEKAFCLSERCSVELRCLALLIKLASDQNSRTKSGISQWM